MDWPPEAIERKTDTANRYLNLLDTFQKHEISKEELDRVCFNAMEIERKLGNIRQRPFTPLKQIEDSYEGVERSEKLKESMRTQDMNLSDELWLEELKYFKSEVGLEMSARESAWFDYVRGNGERPSMEPEPVAAAQDDDDVPF